VPVVRSGGPEGARAPEAPNGVKALGFSSPAADIPAEDHHALYTTGLEVAASTGLSGTCRMLPFAGDRAQDVTL
jgi:hypothetical protein